jgi:hypothetical protein
MCEDLVQFFICSIHHVQYFTFTTISVSFSERLENIFNVDFTLYKINFHFHFHSFILNSVC